jgi:photosystem II stability/assembly factor-like uncharacterized protein
MNEIATDLIELGQRLWPDDSMLRPRERRSAQGRRSVLLSSVIAAATVAILAGVLSAGLVWLRHPRIAAPSPTARPATQAAHIAVLDMLSASDGWGWNAHLIARTTDGASTFTNATPRGLAPGQTVSSFTALDMHDAWAIITTVTQVSEQLPVFHAELDRTTDGGITWRRAPINARAGLMFADALHGWAVVDSTPSSGHLELFRTVDGGARWSLIYETRFEFGCEFSPTFVTRAFGVATFGSCESPSMSITLDGGVTWRSVPLPNPARGRGPALITQAYTVNFTSPRSGSVFLTVCPPGLGTCDGVGALYGTSDGGATWSTTTAIRVGGFLDVGPSGTAWASDSCVMPCVDNNGIPRPDDLLVTGDGGEHWTAEPMPIFPRVSNPASFQFVNSKVGFAVSSSGGHPAGVPETYTYYRTTNGGATWAAFSPRLRG